MDSDAIIFTHIKGHTKDIRNLIGSRVKRKFRIIFGVWCDLTP